MFRPFLSKLSLDERQLLDDYKEKKFGKTRTSAEQVILQRKDSYLASFLLGCIHRYVEGNLVRSLVFLRRAYKSLKKQEQDLPAYTERKLFFEFITLLRQLGRDREAIQMIGWHDKKYPRQTFEDLLPWSLMKIGRHKEAIEKAKQLLKRKFFEGTALNSLCAIHFELGHRRKALFYCDKAVLYAKKKGERADNVIHFSNLSEAHLSLLHFELSERYALKATKHFDPSLHGNPWEFLVDLYVDQGRINDAWNALKRANVWFFRQKLRLSESLYASHKIHRASFYVSLGLPHLAMKELEKVRDRPDRDGYMSSKMEHQILGARIMGRQSRVLLIERMKENASAYGFLPRIGNWLSVCFQRFLLWKEGSLIRKSFKESTLLENTLSPYRPGGASMPYRMVIGLPMLVGPGIVGDALKRIRKKEEKKVSALRPFFNFLDAQLAYFQGRYRDALRVSSRSLKELPLHSKPLRFALHASRGDIYRRLGQFKYMRLEYKKIFRGDASMFRSQQLSVPVSSTPFKNGREQKMFHFLMRSPRFYFDKHGFLLRIRDHKMSLHVELLSRKAEVLCRARVDRVAKESESSFWVRGISEIHSAFFSLRTELSQKDIYSLDNSLLRHPTHHIPWQDLLKNKNIKN